MPDLLELNPHLALGIAESEAADDGPFENWCNQVEAIMGLETLDGDQDIDGYSLDRASDYWHGDLTPREAAAEFRAAA